MWTVGASISASANAHANNSSASGPSRSATVPASSPSRDSYGHREGSGRRFSQVVHHGLDAGSEAQQQQYRFEKVDASSRGDMFRKLRKNGKQIFQSGGSSKRIAEGSLVQDLSYLKIGEGKLTFFDLPPEIRNVIYEDVASDTRLYVLAALPKKKEKESKNPPHTTPNLLLTSKQVRLEYLPLMLERATISFAIRDFDFRNLMRVSSSLYSTELKALRKNPSLTIRLLATKPGKEPLASLRRWAQCRTEDMYTFPVHYSLVWPKMTQLVPTSGSVARINAYIQRRAALVANLEAVAGLEGEVPEALKWELQPFVELFQRELEAMGAIGSSAARGTDPRDGSGQQWLMPMFGR